MRTAKVCFTCKIEKPLNEQYFYKNKANKDGFKGQCKDCIKAYKKEYAKTNKGVIDKYFEENKEAILAYRKQFREENKIELSKKNLEWQRRNKEKLSPGKKRYQTNHREQYNAYGQQRRARKNKLECTFTPEQWQEILIKFNHKCAYCGEEKPLTQDHFIPLSKGGEYSSNNIIPACQSCNCRKNAQDFFKWYPNYEHYSKKREAFILKFLNYKNNIQQFTLALGEC
jgi:5-methylcytosine-specific restriction endonuclease McrA